MKNLFILSVLLIPALTYGQASSEADITKAYQVRKQMAESSLIKNLPARNVGPTVQGGRIIDIDVNHKNTKEFYVGYASAGIFKTVNNGISFEPIFDHNDALGVGDFVLSQQNTNTLYVGTGEKNSSRSSYAGSGVYKTTDGG
ncbi:MAG: glycosyl hydrolase, partial [Cytophagia bacterium]|nr:glycosyl hydrolase [Cytophagia bacterium]